MRCVVLLLPDSSASCAAAGLLPDSKSVRAAGWECMYASSPFSAATATLVVSCRPQSIAQKGCLVGSCCGRFVPCTPPPAATTCIGQDTADARQAGMHAIWVHSQPEVGLVHALHDKKARRSLLCAALWPHLQCFEQHCLQRHGLLLVASLGQEQSAQLCCAQHPQHLVWAGHGCLRVRLSGWQQASTCRTDPQGGAACMTSCQLHPTHACSDLVVYI